MTPEAIRGQFPDLQGRTYMNAASEGPMPLEATREAERLARLKATPWEVGSEHYYQVPADVRSALEGLFRAPSGSIALLAGTSAGIGLAAQRLPLSPGDEVLILEGQFPSNVYPWRAVRQRGASVRVVKRPLGTDPTPPLLEGLDAATRVVSVDWVNFVDGAVVDLETVGAACHERGIVFVVGAAQGAGALRLDLDRVPVDVVAAPSHKWLLGPNGLGWIYVAPRLLPALQSWNAGWVNIAARSGFRNLLRLDGDPPDDATRLETGSPPFSLLAPWKISLDLLRSVGPEAIEYWVLALTRRLVDGILELPAATLVSPPPPIKSGIVSVSAGDRTIPLYRALESQRIHVALREGIVRISPHLYNTEQDIDALLNACRRFLG